jgi:hypothetical protein
MILNITKREREIIADAIQSGIKYRELITIGKDNSFHLGQRSIANHYRRVLKKILAEEGKP